MAKRLTEEAKREIRRNSDLFKKICDALPVSPGSLSSFLYRDPVKLLQHHIVEMIAEAMGVEASEVTEDIPVKQKAVHFKD